MALDAAEVMTWLRERGYVVHHTTNDWHDPARVVVFLAWPEPRGSELEYLPLEIPGVGWVGFSEDTRAIMYVTDAP